MENKKTTTKKTTTSTRKPVAKKAVSKKPVSKKPVAEKSAPDNNNQMKALIMFFSAIVLLFIFFIKGEMLWLFLHNLMTGCFGLWAVVWPILMLYVSIVIAFEKYKSSVAKKIILTAVIIVLMCSTAHIFTNVTIPEDTGFFEGIAYLYTTGTQGKSSGVVGGMLGIPLQFLLGSLGAKIVSVISLIVAIMILTGLTLSSLYKSFSKPAKVVGTKIHKEIEKKQTEHKAEKARRAAEEVEVPPYVEKTKKANADKNTTKTSLEKLNEVFGIQSNKEEVKAEEPVKTEEVEEIKNMEEKSVEAFEQAEKVEEKQETAIPVPEILVETQPEQQVFEPKQENNFESSEIKKEPSSSVVTPIDTSQEHLDEAAKLAEAFIQKREEDEKREMATSAQMALYDEEKYSYCFPPLHLLTAGQKNTTDKETEELQNNGRKLVETLESFGVKTKIIDICRGPSVTRYELQPAAGVKISKITNLSDDIALNLAATGVRIEAPIPGKAAVGIEIPNKVKTVVRMRELIESNTFITAKSNLTVVLGRDISGQVNIADLAKMPHMLIAGTTGSGKSVCINSLIMSLIYKSTPDDVRFLMIDPKVVELGIYNGIPHLLVPVVTDPRKAAGALNWAVTEMLNRYKTFAEFNVKDLAGYNQLAKMNEYEDENGQPMLKMPQVVIIIDELADLMMAAPNEVEDSICRLAQMARAAGMHLVVATQRPTVDVVTGLIKANIPSRIAFAVSSAIDSRTILDSQGAEKLLGQGDMLFSPVGTPKPMRVQGCFVQESEIEAVVEFIKKSRIIEYDKQIINDIEKNAIPENNKKDSNDFDNEQADPMLNDAIKCVIEAGQASTSLLQRRLRLGYARAGRLVDEMEQMGIVGPHEGSKPRQVLMTYNQWLERNMQKSDNEEV